MQTSTTPFPEQAFAESELGRRLLTLHAEGSSSQRILAEHLLRQPMRIMAGSIEDLAASAGVSTATISRFARQAGFDGYPALRGAIAETMQDVIQPVEKLRGRFARADGATAAVDEALEATLSNVRTTAQSLAGGRVEAAAARLAAARTVFVLGFGLSSHLAAMLALDLQPFCAQLVNVVEFGGTEVAAGRLMNVGPGDVLVAISFPRYATDAVRLATYARDRGAAAIVITDSPASPLARIADELLLAPSQHPVLSSSYAGALVVAEALVTALMLSNPQNVAHAERLTEAIAGYLHPVSRGR
ncbi:MAG: MurR/RpiR family transcriptional regulator [Burkholderiales bacterium]|nr:MurR/RpiR family transcriptional regulator [Burkholderiales bacterium]